MFAKTQKIMNSKLDIINIKFFFICSCIILLGLFCSCIKELTFQEKIYARYVGRYITYPPEEILVNRIYDNSVNYSYKLIHIIELTCCSCIETLNKNSEYIDMLETKGVILELVGYSSYKETEFSPVLLQYPFYFDYDRNFSRINKLKNDDITRTFLVKENEVIAVGDMNNDKFRKTILELLKKK